MRRQGEAIFGEEREIERRGGRGGRGVGFMI